MIKNNIVEESTPVFGDAPEAEAPQQNKVLSWDEEKTLLVFEDEEASVSARLLNSETGEAFDVAEFPYLVGRSKTADLQIKHRSVSREHARISLQGGASGFIIEDAASSNGIRVNGIKTTKVMLGDKDRVKFGDVEFLFEVDQDSDSAVAEQTTAVAASQSTNTSPTSNRPDATTGSIGLTSGLSWASVKRRLPFLSAGGANGDSRSEDGATVDGEEKQTSKYPLIAAAAAVVLGLAYVLSPARRVEIIDAPVAQVEKPSESQAASPPVAASTTSAVDQASPSNDESPSSDESTGTTEQPASETAVVTADSNPQDVQDTTQVAAQEPSASDEPAAEAVAATEPEPESTTSTVTNESLMADAAVAASAAEKAATEIAAVDVSEDANGDNTGASDEPTAASAVAASTEAPKPVIRRSPEWSRAYIRNSLEMYTNGDVDNAVRRLRILSRSGRHQPQFRQQAGDLANGIDSMYQQYQTGRSQFDSGRHDDAFLVWRSFLVDEANLLPGQESVFSRNIKSEVVNLYTQQGNTANAEGRRHDAYLAWQKASSIAPNGEAAAALTDLEQRAKQRFIDGYMQESVSLQTATSMWRDVLDMVPPANEYHIKAKAKLRLYKNYGS